MEAVKNDMSLLYVEKDQMKGDKTAEEIFKLFTAEHVESMRKHNPQKMLSCGMYHGSLEILEGQ